MLPYSFVIRNDTGKPVIELTAVATSDGKVAGGFSAGTSTLKEPPVISPGQQRILSAIDGGPVWLRSRPNSQPDLAVRAIDSVAGADELTVSIDAVVYADGLFVGPDTSGQFARLTVWLKAVITMAWPRRWSSI